MGRQVLYGASDDLIELRGDVDEEFYALSEEKGFLATSAGVLVRYTLGEDGWELRVKGKIPDGVIVDVVPMRGEDEGDDEDGCPGYSDKVVITTGTDHPVQWVVHGSKAEVVK